MCLTSDVWTLFQPTAVFVPVVSACRQSLTEIPAQRMYHQTVSFHITSRRDSLSQFARSLVDTLREERLVPISNVVSREVSIFLGPSPCFFFPRSVGLFSWLAQEHQLNICFGRQGRGQGSCTLPLRASLWGTTSFFSIPISLEVLGLWLDVLFFF